MAKQELPLIQGHRPDSIQEVWVAEALDKYKIKFWFQYEISGGLRLRGGLIVDFYLLIRDEIKITLPIPFLYINQPMPFLWQRLKRLGEHSKVRYL